MKEERRAKRVFTGKGNTDLNHGPLAFQKMSCLFRSTEPP